MRQANTVNYHRIDDISDNGIKFAKVFMRLEFALKLRGYGKQINGGLKIDWDRYCYGFLKAEFFNEMKERPKAKILIENPPKKQKLNDDGTLAWVDSVAVTDIQGLGVALRHVRNNLFHGGKHGDPDDNSKNIRKENLFRASLDVIEQILLRDDQLREFFEGN